MGKIYTGRFLSYREVEYVVNIFSKDVETETPEDLVFGEEPAEIEWSEVDKLEPVQGSALTLTLLSTSDRQYIDLYSVETGEVWAEVWRNGSLYWTGTLDTELYEEPYSYLKDYEVQFTFSDFGALERLKWSDKGVRSLEWIVRTCVEAAGLDYSTLNRHISTTPAEGYTDILTDSYLNCENFFDEDDEPMTMREVLEAVLQPFALRMVQKGGRVELFDLNALAAEEVETEKVVWMSDDAELSADVVYNNVKVTFSPYADTTLYDGTIEHDDTLKSKTSGILYYLNANPSEEIDGFRLATGDPEESDELPFELAGAAKLFRIDSEYSASDEAGVYMMSRGSAVMASGDIDKTMVGTQKWLPCTDGVNPNMSSVTEIIKCGRVHLNYCRRNTFRLKIELSVCIDPRYNPFEGEDNNESKSYGYWNDWANFAYLPIKLVLYDTNGNAYLHYSNSDVVKGNSYSAGGGKWVGGAASWGDAWLAFYDRDDRKAKSGLSGWSTNKQVIGYFRDALPSIFEKMGDGEYAPTPPTGGWLELTIGDGIYAFDYKRNTEKRREDLAKINRWFLLKDPKLSIVKANGTDIDVEDQEDQAWLNRSAQEDYEIDTNVGTIADRYASPTARGALLNVGQSTMQNYTRAGVTDRLERLLIGTVFSQYASRKTVLSGTALLMSGLHPLSEASTPGRFIMLSEVQRLQDEESEITMAKFSADDYEGIEYE
jgi:hypothetical protein